MPPSLKDLLPAIRSIATEAGQAILEYYGTDGPVERKQDNSPLTLADQAAHRYITRELAELTPEIPIVSEESADSAAVRRGAGPWVWLVDPLDGTKEFIKQTGQFTVNIGLIHQSRPVLGVIHVPVSGTDYFALQAPEQTAAWTQCPGTESQLMKTRPADPEQLTVVASRDHAGPVVKAFLATLPGANVTSMGSSLKFCLVAEGKADFYPRVVPTMQWDTAAAQAIVEAAGGRVTQLDGRPLAYHGEPLRNPSILTFGDSQIDWPTWFGQGK